MKPTGMKQIFNSIVSVTVWLLCLCQVQLAFAQLNTFEAGQPIRASEMNHNFEVVQEQIDETEQNAEVVDTRVDSVEQRVESLESNSQPQPCSDASMSGRWSVLIGADASESSLCEAYFEGATWLVNQGGCTTYGNDGSQDIDAFQSANFSVDSSCKVTIVGTNSDGTNEVGFGWLSENRSSITGISQNSGDNMVLTWTATKLD